MTDLTPSQLTADKLLLARIGALSESTLPLIAREDPREEDLEAALRLDAERSFQRALCHRVWWNLSAAERDRVRRAVRSEWPEHRRRMCGPLFDLDCMEEIES